MIVNGTPRSSPGERWLRIAQGAMLVASTQAGSLLESAGESVFDPEHWRAQGASRPTSGGRGSSWFIEAGGRHWVLRHYRRGGFVGRFVHDRYVWAGEDRVRSFAEFRLTQRLLDLGLPVPEPIGAAFRRAALTYRCDLITRRIEGAAPLSARLGEAMLSGIDWHRIGAVIARFHAAGLDHADLNAHNILIGADGEVSLIDFDRGRLRRPGVWGRDNLDRLQRSLTKIQVQLRHGRYDADCWTHLMAGYRS